MCGRGDVGAEAAELREAEVVEDDQHHVRGIGARVAAASSRPAPSRRSRSRSRASGVVMGAKSTPDAEGRAPARTSLSLPPPRLSGSGGRGGT